MQYRIVQRRVVELSPSKDYSEEEVEAHRRLHPDTSNVVWEGEQDENFGEKFFRDPKWHTSKDWPRTAQSGWVSYSYRLERYDEETQTWQDICHVEPVCV